MVIGIANSSGCFCGIQSLNGYYVGKLKQLHLHCVKPEPGNRVVKIIVSLNV